VSKAPEHGIACEEDGPVLRILIDRPERKNSIDVAAVQSMVGALERAATSDSLRAILLSGSGPDFCSGSDWVASNAGGEKPRTGSVQRRTPLQAHRLVELLMEVQLPVVCAVRGWAAGLGAQLALAADFAVVAEDATFWFPFVKRGFTPDSGSSWLLPRLVGVAKAKEILMLGRPLSGKEAADSHLIHLAVSEDHLDHTVEDLVAELIGSATVAVGLTKRCINAGLVGGLADAMEHESLALELATRSVDFREGLRAFTERRDPRFEGR